MTSRVYRLDPKSGKKQYPVRDRQGYFTLGDPSQMDRKHTKENQIKTNVEEKMISFILNKGYSVRVKTDTSPSLVRLNIYIDDEKIS